MIKHVSYFNVSATAKEIDRKFADLLDITPLDTEDQLSMALTWKGAYVVSSIYASTRAVYLMSALAASAFSCSVSGT